MKPSFTRVFAIFVVVVTSLQISCSDNEDEAEAPSAQEASVVQSNPPSQESPAPQESPVIQYEAWNLARYQESCFPAARDRRLCRLEQVVFEVEDNGEFRIGPPDENPLTGTLAAKEIEQINELANVLIAEELTGQAVCDERADVTASARTELQLSDGDRVEFYRSSDQDDEVCTRGGHVNAEAFTSALSALLNKYILQGSTHVGYREFSVPGERQGFVQKHVVH